LEGTGSGHRKAGYFSRNGLKAREKVRVLTGRVREAMGKNLGIDRGVKTKFPEMAVNQTGFLVT
jgi:hypothetical protein